MTNLTPADTGACACCGDMLCARFDRRSFLHLSA
jgi:hypothetical protein